MKNSRWMIYRVGLVNFWYYDEEEFQFLDGRMLLRGSNGSGKSVTMQSFIPLLLDGNMRPERLDPFGSRARKMENYLLEEEDAREERIGYLYMELKRGETDQYVTLGIGMRARKYKKLESWYFCITDGRRIGKDFLLYQDVREKIPYTKQELRNRLKDGGKVMDTQREYMEQVNRLLFGFETLEEYKELLELLIQLRTPKLSKDFKPSVINDILSSSLQTLSEDDLRPLSEAIENMDNIKANMQELQAGIKAATAIDRIFSVYNKKVLYEKADGFLQAKKEVEELEKQERSTKDSYETKESEEQEEEENHQKLKRENDLLEEERKSLENHDAFRLKQEEQSLAAETERLRQNMENKQKQREKKEELYRGLEEKRKRQDEKNEMQWEQAEKELAGMEEILTDLPFDSGRFLVQEMKEAKGEEISFAIYEKEYQEYLKLVESGIGILQKERMETERYDERLLELEECRQRRSDAQKEQIQYENLLQEAKGELLEEIYRWNEKNQVLKLPEKTLGEISIEIEGYRFGKDYSRVKEILRTSAEERKEEVREEIREVKDVLLPKQREAEALEKELRYWEEIKDPEPEREPGVVRCRKKLEDMGISCVPLYEVIDFSEDLTENQTGRLEEALSNMGLLDALVLPVEEKERVLSAAAEEGLCDRYLFGDAEALQDSLLQCFRVDAPEEDGRLCQTISDVLSEIGTGQGTSDGMTWVGPDGSFQIGVLHGTVTGEYQPKFIGKASRERYRMEKMETLQKLLQVLGEEISSLEKEMEGKEQTLFDIGEEERTLPSESGLISVAKDLSAVEHRLENIQADVRKKEEAVQAKRKDLEKIRTEVQEICQRAYLTIRLDVFEAARDALREYGVSFRQAEKIYEIYRNGLSMLQGYLEQMEEVEADLDDILYDLGQVQNQKKKTEERLEAVRTQLQMSDYRQIQERLEHCVSRLEVLPELREKSVQRKTQLLKDMEQLKERLAALEEKRTVSEKRKEQMKWIFQKEFALGYTGLAGEEREGKAETTEELAVRTLRELGKMSGQTAEDLHGKVQEVFHENKGYLSEYRMMMQTIFGELKESCDAVSVRITRLDIRARYRGMSVSFPELLEKLTVDAEVQERLLSDKDKELFEDILAGIISKKIRAKIHASKRWVKNMNQLMESMQTSSGLRLSLKWKSKKAEKEEQLDTGSLVELLEQDVEIMQEAEIEKLSRHFRSKIAQARLKMDGEGNVQSFHVIMREILDYRAWFEFCLECQKTGEKKKEMTDRVFFTFSGGEKAMSMYVPLFSAVVAKYSGAREDAPRLISLDEAFAGVDEMNIQDMFRLMVELQFNFMINSQILWGDYETVPALAIYQLIRPQNAKYVSVIAYTWNGKVRELVTDSEHAG